MVVVIVSGLIFVLIEVYVRLGALRFELQIGGVFLFGHEERQLYRCVVGL